MRPWLFAATALCGLVLAIVAARAFAAAGGFDPDFGDAGSVTFGFANGASSDFGSAVAIQPNGKIVVAGRSDQGGTGFDFAVARLNPGGRLDRSFSTDGMRSFGFANATGFDQAQALAIQGDGKIVVAGESVQSGTGFDIAVARLNPGGGLDQGFSGDGKRTFGFANGEDGGSGVAIQPNGKIVVAGGSFQSGKGNDFAVARLNPGGGLDRSFSTDGRRTFGFPNGAGANHDAGTDVAIQPNGRIVVPGQSEQGGTGYDFAVARLNPDGGLDRSFSTDGRRTFGLANGANLDFGSAVAIQPNGKIVVAGASSQSGTGPDFAVARLNPGGGLDRSFSTDGRRTFGFANGENGDGGSGVAIQPNGKIVVAGGSFQSGKGTDFAVARLNPGGGLDHGFSRDGKRTFGFANGANEDRGAGLAIQPNGKIVVAGGSIQSGKGNDFAVARLLGG